MAKKFALVILLISATLASAYALRPGRPIDLEEVWYARVKTSNEVVIQLHDGKLAIAAKELSARVLGDAIAKQYDEKGRLVFIHRAQKAELKYHKENNAMRMRCRNVTSQKLIADADGTTSNFWAADQDFMFDLAESHE